MGAARSSHWIEERLRRRVESLLVLLGAEEVARPSIDVVIASARKARIQFRCAHSDRAMGLGIARVLPALLSAALLLQAYGREASAATKTEHIRGTIESVEGDVVTVATSSGSVRIQLAPSTPIARVVQSDRAHITDGRFLGITSVTDPDGSQRAVEDHVFPEAMRGAGEGSYGWAWPGVSLGSKMTNGTAVVSKMTNGTVSSSRMTNGTVAAQASGSSLTLEYRSDAGGGSQTITIPPGIPVVALEPGQSADLQPGVHVFVVVARS